jgi:hypothetical protein
MKRFLFLIIIFFFLLFVQVFAQEKKIKLKDGTGKSLVENNCAVCHSLDYVVMNSPFLDRKGWEGEANKMVNIYGASIKGADIPQIVDYLNKYYGKRD